jgi:hypothetical protein
MPLRFSPNVHCLPPFAPCSMAFALPPLRDLFVMDDDDSLMWAQGAEGIDLLEPRCAAPHGADLAHLQLVDEPRNSPADAGGRAAAAAANSTAAQLSSHPLWPALMDAYFACIKVRPGRGTVRTRTGTRARARARDGPARCRAFLCSDTTAERSRSGHGVRQRSRARAERGAS